MMKEKIKILKQNINPEMLGIEKQHMKQTDALHLAVNGNINRA